MARRVGRRPGYHRDWYAADRESQSQKARELRAKRKAFLDEYKLSRGCADCGYREHAVALDFDRVRGEKVGNVPTMASRVKMEVLLAEIEKCDIVCANCHRVRTLQRLREGKTVD